MNKCENCVGEGLVGQGPEPWLRQGHIETCPVCLGTGIKAAPAAPESVQTAEPENLSSETEPAPVDNTPAVKAPESPNLSEGSSIGSGADGMDQEGTPE